MSFRKKSVLSVMAVTSLALAMPLFAEILPENSRAKVIYPVKVDSSPALRSIPIPPAKPFAAREIPNRADIARPSVPGTSTNVQNVPGVPNTPDPLGGWAGLNSDTNNTVVGGRLMPPDTQGDIGKDHYIQWINLVWAVYDKNGNKVYPTSAAALPGNILWTGFGGQCELQNDGDPITLWDPLAERWVMSQFAVSGSPIMQCLAISKTSDPTGEWWRYAYTWPGSRFNDYPKLGVWSDGYYITTNDFNLAGTAFLGVTVGAFERAKMLAGQPAAFAYFQTSGDREYSVLPVDLDGTTAPPAGAPGLFAEFQDSTWFSPPLATDEIWVFEFVPNWANPTASTFGVGANHDPNYAISISDVSANCSGRDCVPQGNASQKVDDIDFRTMHRLAYRNMGGVQSMVTSMTVGAGGRAGVWWGEFRNTGSGWTKRQDGVYSPTSAEHRWMPSAAQDTNGNVMLGYSISNATTMFPSVSYAGRLANDPLGTIGDEKSLVVGAAAQTGGNRWGDYSMMSIDPTDDCTFWYTQEYVAVGGSFQWQTYIGKMKFPTCSSGPSGMINGYVKSTAGGVIAGATVQIGSYSTTTNASGFYQITVPVGTYDVTASKFGFSPNTVTGQAVTEGGTTVVPDILLTPAGSYFVDGYVTAADHNWPLWAKIEIKQGTTLVNTLYTSPWNGYYVIELPNGYTYDFTVTSMYTGYQVATRPVTLSASDQVQNFSLLPAAGNPAYTCILQGGINEQFEGGFPPLGWNTIANAGTTNVWHRNDFFGAINRTTAVGGSGYSAAAEDSVGGNWDSELWSPPVQLPADPRRIRFASNFQDFAGAGQAWFQISTNGGNTWTTLWYSSVDDPASGQAISADLTAYAGQLVIFRWRYVDDNYNGAWYWQIDNVRTETIPVMPPPSLYEAFEGTVPPAGWTQVDATVPPSGVIWKSNVAWGRTPNPVSGGTGNAAGCDVDKAGSGKTYDCSLITSAFSVDGLNTPTLTVKVNYNDISTTANRDYFDIDVSSNGGTSWTSLAHYNVDVTGTVSFNLTGKASGTNNKLRFRYYTVDLLAHWDWYAYIDDVTVSSLPPAPVVDTPSLSCQPVAGSMVAGFVTDENSAAGIVGAKVARDLGGSMNTMAATGGLSDGFYYMFSAAPVVTGPSTRTFTASKQGYGTVEKLINLVPDTINRLDFALPAASLTLSGWPFVMDGRLTPDGQPTWDKTDSFSVLNTGGLPATLKLSVIAMSSTWPVKWPAFIPQIGPKYEKTSMGRAKVAPKPSTAKRYPLLSRPVAGVPAFGVDIYPGENFVTWPDAAVPGTWTVIKNVPGSNYFGGDFLNGDFSKLYAIDYSLNQLHTINTTTGAVTVVGSSIPDAGQSWTGLKGSSDGKVYGAATDCAAISTLYTINPATGAATAVGPITNAVCIIDIAINKDGEIYGVDLASDSLIKINPATGAGTVVGSLGVDANYAQGMDFEEESGVLYWAAYTTTGELRTINTATGASFLVGAFPGGAEVDAFAFASGGGAATVPWLNLAPMEATVPAKAAGVNGQLTVQGEFLPGGVNTAHFGLFRAEIKSTNNTPMALPSVPVYFTKAFWDVPRGHWADAFIHAVAGFRITRGCGNGNFCPDDSITRANMAQIMVRAFHGADFTPPPAIGIFADVVISDTDQTADYIEQLYNDGIVAGCRMENGKRYYCPNDLVNRAQMSVFLLAGLGIPPVNPPTGYFTDVVGDYAWAAGYAEAAFNAGITAGCGPNIFCPAFNITRAQLAVWLTVGLDLPHYTHPAAP